MTTQKPETPHAAPSGPDGLLVYRYNAADPIPDGAFPAPRADLLRRVDIDGLIKVLALLMPWAATSVIAPTSSHSGFRIRISRSTVYIPIGHDLCAHEPSTVSKLVDMVPSVNRWLDDWKKSTDREPDMAPAWATALGIDERMVASITNKLYSWLAGSTTRKLQISDLNGHTAMLVVPTQSELDIRGSKVDKSTKHFCVSATEEIMTGMTPGGQAVVFRGVAGRLPTQGRVALASAAIRRIDISVSSHVQVVKIKRAP